MTAAPEVSMILGNLDASVMSANWEVAEAMGPRKERRKARDLETEIGDGFDPMMSRVRPCQWCSTPPF